MARLLPLSPAFCLLLLLIRVIRVYLPLALLWSPDSINDFDSNLRTVSANFRNVHGVTEDW